MSQKRDDSVEVRRRLQSTIDRMQARIDAEDARRARRRRRLRRLTLGLLPRH